MKTNRTLRRNHSHRARALLAVTAAATLALSTTPLFAPPPGAGKGKATAAKITLLDVPGDRIQSDGKGTYVHGVDAVTAVIHNSGQLELNTNDTKQKRKVSLNYSEILSGTGCSVDDSVLEVPDLNCNGVADDSLSTVTWGSLFTLDLNLLSMTEGESRTGGFGVSFQDWCGASSHVPWRIRFQHQGTQDSVYSCGASCSAPVTVEAFDDNPNKGVAGTGVDTWIISAEAPAGLGAEACLWSGGTGEAVLREIVRMPFHMVVELK
jgi:hypothetical protein